MNNQRRKEARSDEIIAAKARIIAAAREIGGQLDADVSTVFGVMPERDAETRLAALELRVRELEDDAEYAWAMARQSAAAETPKRATAKEFSADEIAAIYAEMGRRHWRAAAQAHEAEDWIGRAVASALKIEGRDWKVKAAELSRRLEALGLVERTFAISPKRKKVPVLVAPGALDGPATHDATNERPWTRRAS